MSVLLPLHMSRMSRNFLFYPRLLSMQGESREATCPAQRNLRHQRFGKRINPGRERNKPPPCRATGQLIVLRRDLLVPVGLSPSSIFSKVRRSQYSSNRPFDAKSFTSASPAAIWNPSSLCWKTLLFYHLPQGRASVDRLDPSFFAILMEARLFSPCTVPSRRGVRPPYVHVSPSPLPQLFACSLLSHLNVREKSGELLHRHPKVVLICSGK